MENSNEFDSKQAFFQLMNTLKEIMRGFSNQMQTSQDLMNYLNELLNLIPMFIQGAIILIIAPLPPNVQKEFYKNLMSEITSNPQLKWKNILMLSDIHTKKIEEKIKQKRPEIPE